MLDLGKGELKKIIGDEVYEKTDCNLSDKEINKLNAIRKRRGVIEMVKHIDYDKQMEKTGKKLFSDKIELVETGELKINPYQKNWFSMGSRNSDKPEHLMESIKKYGIKTPIKITKDFVIIGGHRRHSIALQLHLSKVPCQIANYKLTEDELKLHTIEDNYLQREIGGNQRRQIYSDLIGLIKKQFPNWEYMIREERGKLQEKLEGIGLSTKTAEKITTQERRKAKREDSSRIKGIIQTDAQSMIKNAKRLSAVFEDTNKETREYVIETLKNELSLIIKEIK